MSPLKSTLLSLLLMACVACGYSCRRRVGPLPGGEAASVIYVRRELPSGRFRGFRISGYENAKALHQALEADIAHKDMDSEAAILLSVNHMVWFLDETGRVVGSYEILGDDYVVLGGTRYYCTRTLAKLREFVANGSAKRIPLDELRRIEYVSRAVDSRHLEQWPGPDSRPVVAPDTRLQGTPAATAPAQ